MFFLSLLYNSPAIGPQPSRNFTHLEIRMLRRASLLSLVAAFVLLASAAVAGPPPPPPVMPGDLLGSTGALGASLIQIDPMTGAGTFRGPLNTFGPVTEIDFRDDGVLFGATGGGTSNLITIDPETGIETLVGMHAFGSLNGLEFVGGTLYGAWFDPGSMEGAPPTGGATTQLVTVDTTDASLTTIAQIDGFSLVRGLAYDASSDTMYGVGSPTTEGIAGDQLFTVDLGTGATTAIGFTGAQIVGGIEFGPDGLLYGGVAQGGIDEGVTDDGDLVVFNLASGDATTIGNTGFPAISGLSFVPSGAIGGGPPVVEVPTASTLGLLALLASLMVAGVLLLRRG